MRESTDALSWEFGPENVRVMWDKAMNGHNEDDPQERDAPCGGITQALYEALASSTYVSVRLCLGAWQKVYGPVGLKGCSFSREIRVQQILHGTISVTFDDERADLDREPVDLLMTMAARCIQILLEQTSRPYPLVHSTRHLMAAAKMETLGTLVSGLAHEINNPNHIAILGVQNLLHFWNAVIPFLDTRYADQGDYLVKHIPYSEFRKEIPAFFFSITDSLQRIECVVASLRDFVRRQPPDPLEDVDMNLVVKAAVVLLAGVLRKTTCHFSEVYEPALPKIRGHYQNLELVAL